MSLGYVLNQVGAKIGLNPNAPGSRSVLLRYANEAADELWSECDITGSIMEQTFRINGDQTIAMPVYVGQVRAVRDYASGIPTHINQLRPRYNEYNWTDNWRNFRLKNTQALTRTISNSAPLTVSVSTIDTTPIVVNITGSTEVVNSITESFTMSALSVTGVVNFIDVVAVTKSAISSSNVIVKDVDGNILTVLVNDALEARYQILDISNAPWLTTSSSSLDNYCEVLYKKALPNFTNNNQEFPAQGYDNQWINKCLQIYYEDQGKTELALAYDSKATRGLARKKIEQNLPAEDCVAFVSNPHDTMIPRIRSTRFMRWFGTRR